MDKGKTSTFIIDHDRCDPSKWTPGDVLTLAKFVKGGELRHAAVLAGLGVQLVMSEHHTPVGGTLESIGWVQVSSTGALKFGGEPSEDFMEVLEGESIAPVAQIYRGPTVWAVGVPTSDGHGNYDGTEYETAPTEAEARACLVCDEEEPHGG